MLKTIDRYIIKQFLGTFLFILVVIMAVAVVFDISEKTEDFTRMTATFGQIVLDYYLNFIIYYSNLFSGLLIFIAVILFTGRLAHRSEVIAILSSGVSFPRFLRPYFISATVLTIVALAVTHYVLPNANRTRLAFEEVHIRVPFRVEEKDLHREIAPGVIAYFQTFSAQQQTGYRVSITRWVDGEPRSKLTADRARFDTLTGRWTMYDYVLREVADPLPAISTLGGKDGPATRPVPQPDRIVRGAQMDTLIALKPADLGQRNENATSMTSVELNSFIKEEVARGSNKVAFYMIEKHQRTAYPFATFVFTLIGVGVASRKVRGGTGVHLALGLLLTLLYIFAMKMTTVAATNAGFDPLAAVWLPNIVFSLVGIWIYRRAPK